MFKSMEEIIIRPLLSEKTSMLTEKFNRYTFEVGLSATKGDIKQAIEGLFNVKVMRVNTLIRQGKMQRFGRFAKKGQPEKRALVDVKSGQKIELFKGV